jgi:small subunit ribosomal protein S9
MQDDERTDENGQEAEDQAGKDAEDQPEEVQGEETVVEEESAEEESADEAPAEEAPADEAPADEAPADEAPAEEKSEAPESKKDTVPGAELDPIQLEPERPLSAEERAKVEAEAEERARLEAEATAETPEEEVARPKKLELPDDALIQATGKRKSSIARVILRPGKGEFEVNERTVDDYFPRQSLRTMARQALLASGYESVVDIRARVHGGGISGQAGAVRHGIARALCEVDPELRAELKRRGMLTRDARKKERRKAGLKKARKRPQFSKR